VSAQRLTHKPFGRSKISVFAEVELYCGAGLVDSPVKIQPFATDLDIGLIHVPIAKDAALPAIERLKELGCEVHHPTMDRRVIQPDAAFEDHLFQVPKAKAVGQIPANAQQNDRTVEMATFEHGLQTPSQSKGAKVSQRRKIFATEPSFLTWWATLLHGE